MKFLCGSVEVYRTRGEETLHFIHSFIGNLLVFGEEVGRLKEFGPLCFPLQNLVCDAET